MKTCLLAFTAIALVSASESFDEGYYAYSGSRQIVNPDRVPDAVASSDFNLWEQRPNPPLWTWTVNITEVPSTNTTVSNATEVLTTYGLRWPDTGTEGNLNDQLEAAAADGNLRAGNFCVTVVQSLFPANTTNGFNSSGRGAGTCGTGFFNCYNALLRQWYASGRDPSTGCLGRSVDPTTLDDCQGTWDTYNAETYNLWNSNIQNGSAFFYRGTRPYSAGNTTYLDAERNRLHMIIMDYGASNEIVCARATSNNASLETGGVDDPNSGGSGLGVNVWLAGLVCITVVLALL